MSKIRDQVRRALHAGIRVSWLNALLILLGLVLSAFIIRSTYRTEDTFRAVFSTTENYMNSQQTTGMLDSLSVEMAAECRSFLSEGDPAHVHAFAAQYSLLNEQLAISETARQNRRHTEADEHLDNALASFRQMNQMELHAMRLVADTLPVPMQAYPELLQSEPLTAEEQAFSPDQKRAAAEALISSPALTEAKVRMEGEISINHRLNSEISSAELDAGTVVVHDVVASQKLYAFLFILFAVLAMIVNHLLTIRPIRRSVRSLDRREKIPVHGSFEVRRMAAAYNSLLEENQRKEEALTYTATHDALTDVLNRAAFEEVYHSPDLSGFTGLIIADVDHFKYYNDNHGHDIGDRVLQAVADSIRRHVREGDQVFRIGGDEFVVLLKNKADEDAIPELVRQINERLSSGAGGIPCLTISAGIAFRSDLEAGEDLFKAADIALLEVKEHGRCGSAVYKKKA